MRALFAFLAAVVLMPGWAFAAAPTMVLATFDTAGADAATVAKVLAAQPQIEAWALTDLAGPATAEQVAAGTGDGRGWKAVTGTKSATGKMAVVYDETRLTYIRQFEVITKLNEACGAVARPPFIVEFGHKGLGGHFWLMVVQLSAEDGNGRLCQSSYLNQWAQANTMPLVLMGDFAYDWRLSGDEHDAGYDLLAEADRLHWVRPEPPAATRCDGTAIADFVFTGGKARAWKAHARVLGEADCGGRPGHRPVEAVFAF